MMKTPTLRRINAIFIFGIALVVIMHFARSFLIPFTTGIILAMLVLPVCRKLESWGWKRGWAILASVLIIILVVAALVVIMTAPISSFNQDLPDLKESMEEVLTQVQQFISEKLSISVQEQDSLMEQASEAMSSASGILTGFVTGFFGFLFDIILVLVYIAFFLNYREQYENFVVKLNDENDPDEIREVIEQISKVSTQYLIGRLLSIVVLAVLYTIGLTLVGLKYAILMGSIAAILTIVPYVGTALGGAIPAAAALLSGSGDVNPLAALGVIFVVQMLDDYLLEPFIVGDQVDISPLTIIVGVVIGGLVWGVAGMILFIPLLGMVKIIFDHVPALQPYAYLIGSRETEEKEYVKKVKQWFQKKFSKS